MYNKNLIDFSEINFKSGVPKYKQLINHLIKKVLCFGVHQNQICLVMKTILILYQSTHTVLRSSLKK